MADPIAWGLEIINGQKTDKVQDTLDGLDIETPLENGLNEMQATLNTAISQMEGQVDEMQEAINKSPAGCAPPWLESISAASQEDGIKLTYKARFLQGRVNSTENWLFAQTKGVMVRYSSEGYPTNRNEGTLAFIDEDLFTVDESGVVTAKTKTNTLVGLTTNTKYYISAFPYSTYNVYNETLNQNNGSNQNLNNTTSCTWTGTKGTLTVTITQNYNYKPLGEITATMTPTAGGDAKTGTRTGAGDIAISGLEAGQYTLSFSSYNQFTTPASQQITITAGQPNTTTAQYKMSSSINDYSWAEIFQFAQAGVINNLFAYGSKKQTLVAPITGSAGDGYSLGSATQKNVIFIGTNNHASNTATFVTENQGSSIRMEDFNNAGGSVFPYSDTKYFSFLATSYTSVFPEIHQYIKQVSVKTRNNSGGNNDNYGNRDTEDTNFNARIFPMVNRANRNYQWLTSNLSSNYNLENGNVWIGCSTGEYHWGSTDYNFKVYNGYTEGRYQENQSGDSQELRVSQIQGNASPIVFCIG